MKFKQFFKEFPNPSLKCDRKGHKEGVQERTGIIESRYLGSQYAKAVERRKVCKRCKVELTDWNIHRQTQLDSLTLRDDKWDILLDEGAIWSRPYFVHPERDAKYLDD